MLTLTASTIAGCAVTGDFCYVATAIRPSAEDRVTNDTKRQIVKHNTYGADHCGWK